MLRRILCLGLLAFVFTAAPASAQYVDVAASVENNVISGSGCEPGSTVTFTLLTILLLRAAKNLPVTTVTPAGMASQVAGAALVAFGWTYPHFLRTDTWLTYAYASPIGLLPCPTLSLMLGVTLIVGGLRSARWSMPLVVMGLLYGWIGVFWLRVSLDVGLLAGAVALGMMVAADRVLGPVRATNDERRGRLPGDELVAAAVGAFTHAITIDGAPGDVWPWLAQMGAGTRGGWYSYDLLDNGRHASTARIMPELQQIGVGTVFPAMPGVTDGFLVLACEPQRSLVLGWPNPDGSPLVTWTFVLERSGDTTRLIVRVRAGQGYRFRGLPVWLSQPVVRLVHLAMQRKQLLGIRRRVESVRAAIPNAAVRAT